MQTRLLPLLAPSLLLLAGSSPAQNLPDYAGRWYFLGDIGPAFTGDVDVEEFLGPVNGVEIEFDPGVQFAGGAGYYLTDWLAMEGQMGFLSSPIESFNGLGSVDENNSSLTQVPFLFNLVLQYPTRIGVVPFGGVGGGISFSVLDVDEVTDYTSFYVDGADTDAVAAYQLFAGLRFELNPQMELGVIYRYLATEDAEWDVDSFYFAPPLGDIAIDGIEAHSLNVTFRMRF